MKSLWNDADAERAVERWGSEGRDVALRVYTSRLIGSEPALVLHGGGNTSVKGIRRNVVGDDVETLWVKGSGSSLDKVEPRDFPALDLVYLRRLRALGALTDEEMVNQLRTHLFDASSPNPSVEALLHAFLPHKFVDHSHADAIVALTNQVDGLQHVREALGDRVSILPYIMPGFPLARAVADLYESRPGVIGVVLDKHGLFTFGETARESYERHIELVDLCERYAASRSRPVRVEVSSATEASAESAIARDLARIAPRLRGLLADGDKRLVMDARTNATVRAHVAEPDAQAVFETVPITPDHVIRTKPWPMFVTERADAPGFDAALEAAVKSYRARYDAYFEAGVTARAVSRKKLDSAPRVVLVPGLGVLAFGKTKADAEIAADITERTLVVKRTAATMSGYRALGELDLFDMEYWSLEQAKLGKAAERPLERQVVLVTGAAGAIGRGIADACAEAGAHLVLADLDAEATARVATEINQKHRSLGAHGAIGVACDVTSEASVRAAFDAACVAFGGVDVVVPNAGIALVRPLSELSLEEARRVADVNYLGVLSTIREAARVFGAQRTGGSIIVNSSKNVFSPGKDFGAYSASKAAAHQISKIAAIELAPLGVRVNMINADAVFAHGATRSGLWNEVGPARAKSRGLTMDELEAYYRDRNLLRARVEARHVGDAVVFFATRAPVTTGATLPIDGGIAEAFPR
ncbi:MAG: bifunctional aldolase/short-chain dehydrogenase [Polyangiaceae bacterium]